MVFARLSPLPLLPLLLLCLALPLAVRGGAAAAKKATVQQHHLSTPRLLLPAVSSALESIRYNLSASGGCYVWESRRPDVVRVHSHAGAARGC